MFFLCRSWDIREQAELDKYILDSQIFSLGCCPTDDYVAVRTFLSAYRLKETSARNLGRNGEQPSRSSAYEQAGEVHSA